MSISGLDHWPTDQIFSYYYQDQMLHFNATLLARIREVMPKQFGKISMDIEQDVYDMIMQHRGIEEPKVERLSPKSLREPGYGVILPDNSFVMVDGHHRLVRRYRGGLRTMVMFVTDKQIWQHCLVEYPKELEELIAAEMPPKVDNPPVIASAVTIHGRDE